MLWEEKGVIVTDVYLPFADGHFRDIGGRVEDLSALTLCKISATSDIAHPKTTLPGFAIHWKEQ